MHGPSHIVTQVTRRRSLAGESGEV